jgi:tRNA pseudouridine38-40 synthase
VARYAVRLAYDGTRFHGNQAQPEPIRTVHREVETALRKLGTDEPRLRWAGRTDAGVSSRGNVVAVDTDFDRARLLQALTRNMEDAWAWALADVDAAFDPRRAARARHYRYHLRSDLDAAALRDALQSFVGTHDFTGFCRLEPDTDPVRTVTAVDVARRGPLLVIDVRGESFLWNQVRRMVEAARRVAKGDLLSDIIPRTLAAGKPAELGTAVPYPLVLMDVQYGGVAFERGDDKLFEKLRWRDQDLEMELALHGAMME